MEALDMIMDLDTSVGTDSGMGMVTMGITAMMDTTDTTVMVTIMDMVDTPTTATNKYTTDVKKNK